MNELNVVKSRKDIERYILKKLKEIYWQFPREVSSNTTFKELERYSASDLTDPGLLIYLEEELGVELSDEEVQKLDEQQDIDIAAFIDAIIRHVALTKVEI
ncbi:hypothetical protein FJZ31_36835 [Candidatus Poribacteria bacterium]|nr:hypothetical protein [Candidatus Poribacteria bacterium]